jgi:hypothetical protein
MSFCDDENESSCCYDETVQTPGQATASIVGASSTAGKSKLCGKCFLFWIVLLAVVIGLLWKARKG